MVPLSDVVFAYDFDRLTDGGLLYDYGPNGLHATPGVGAAAPTRNLGGSYSFNGAPQYFSLPLAFYKAAPTAEHIWIARTQITSGDCIFSCENNATLTGYNLRMLVASVLPWLYNYHLRAGGGLIRYTYPTSIDYFARPITTILTVETTPRAMRADVAVSPAWTVGGFVPDTYNTAVQPRIGTLPAGEPGANPLSGRLYYLALLKNAISSADMAQLSAMLSESKKPFCYR